MQCRRSPFHGSAARAGIGVLAWIAVTGSVFAAAPERLNEVELRRVTAWQTSLDRVGISPGLIDGLVGPKTRLATFEFQRVRGLPKTGRLDKRTAAALKVAPDHVFVRYAIEPADLKEIGPAPESWLARSKLKRLGHRSLLEVVAEKFHCHRRLLKLLNPGKRIASLKPGDRVIVPKIVEREDWPPAAKLEINLQGKVVRVIGRQRQLVALFHCSVAAKKSKRPKRNGRVANIVHNPWYTFDPDMYPEVKEDIDRKLSIPPGPRNPVGRCWIGLSLPGYGIHGTPNPELIGKTGSHGCFRLANWDAIRLSKMVKVGTPVHFVTRPEPGFDP